MAKKVMDKFYNKNGTVNLYGFCCGKTQKKEVTYTDGSWDKSLYMEHGIFHVKSHLWFKGELIRSEWETYDVDQLTKARKCYASMTERSMLVQD